MKSKKKLLTSAVALGTAAAMVLGGTFAWQSISQTATNEASDIVNPGGRLHNDQHWVSDLENDTNIYVENFTEAGKGEDIYARVRLSEYMEVVMNYGTDAEVVETIAGKKTPVDGSGQSAENASQKDAFSYTYAIHDFVKDFAGDEENKNPTSDFFTWTEGKADSETVYYMPTFNKNKDSVAADLNGLYADTLGGISNREKDQYLEYTDWAENDTMEGNAIYDGDSNTDDELKSVDYADLLDLYVSNSGKDVQNAAIAAAIDNKDIILVEEEHTATQVGETKGLISLSAWLEKAENDGYKDENGSLTEDGKEALYGYWVYDDSDDGDGWVYWSAPIAAGETTGLLLDGFKLNGVMDDTWYYAIDVEAQFVTADDVGSVEDNDGFYHLEGIDTAAIDLDDEDDGETETTTPKAVSADAEELLKLIGVEIGESVEEDNGDEEDSYYLNFFVSASPNYFLPGTEKTVELSVTNATLSYWKGDKYITENVPESELEKVEWSVSDSDDNVTLSKTTGSSISVTIGEEQQSGVFVGAKLSYKGIEEDRSGFVSNKPVPVGVGFYRDGVDYPYGNNYYVAGEENEIEVVFFKEGYPVTYREYQKSNAFTNPEKAALEEELEWKLGIYENYQFTEKNFENVTLEQDVDNLSKVTLSIPEGFNETIALSFPSDDQGCPVRGGKTMHCVILHPKAENLNLSWSEGATDDGKNVTVNMTGEGTMTPSVTVNESAGNESIERTPNFYLENLRLPDGYKTVRIGAMYENKLAICREEASVSDDDAEALVVFKLNTGEIQVTSALDEELEFSYQLVVVCDGVELNRDVSVTLNPDNE